MYSSPGIHVQYAVKTPWSYHILILPLVCDSAIILDFFKGVFPKSCYDSSVSIYLDHSSDIAKISTVRWSGRDEKSVGVTSCVIPGNGLFSSTLFLLMR